MKKDSNYGWFNTTIQLIIVAVVTVGIIGLSLIRYT